MSSFFFSSNTRDAKLCQTPTSFRAAAGKWRSPSLMYLRWCPVSSSPAHCVTTPFFSFFLFEAQSHSGTRRSSSLCRTHVATIHGGSVRKTLLCLKKRLQPRGGRTNGCRQSRTKPVPRGSERGGCEILFSELLPEQTPS